jgi:hypothetical protein
MQLKAVLVVLPALVQFVTVGSLFSPYGHDIFKQAALRKSTHNLVVGWRQYGDTLLYR